MTSVAFQSNLRKQIRELPKILKSVKIIQYYSILFIRVLSDVGPREQVGLPHLPGLLVERCEFVHLFGERAAPSPNPPENAFVSLFFLHCICFLSFFYVLILSALLEGDSARCCGADVEALVRQRVE